MKNIGCVLFIVALFLTHAASYNEFYVMIKACFESGTKNIVQVFFVLRFQIKARMVSYFLGLRNQPWTVFQICLSIIISAISMTVFISTFIYCKTVKKSRVGPQGNIIKIIRRQIS